MILVKINSCKGFIVSLTDDIKRSLKLSKTETVIVLHGMHPPPSHLPPPAFGGGGLKFSENFRVGGTFKSKNGIFRITNLIYFRDIWEMHLLSSEIISFSMTKCKFGTGSGLPIWEVFLLGGGWSVPHYMVWNEPFKGAKW